jgi:hypothetical protein
MQNVVSGSLIECVHNIHREQHLTIGKYYTVVTTFIAFVKRNSRVTIMDDTGNLFDCGHWRFKPVYSGNIGIPVPSSEETEAFGSEIDYLKILKGY